MKTKPNKQYSFDIKPHWTKAEIRKMKQDKRGRAATPKLVKPVIMTVREILAKYPPKKKNLLGKVKQQYVSALHLTMYYNEIKKAVKKNKWGIDRSGHFIGGKHE